jgi:UDP-N-acetylmuramoylalanine--D-glutamate ligase
LLGQTAQLIADTAKKYGFNDIIFVDSLKEAVLVCAKEAEPGDSVLLSPACASWGMFDNYEQRGDMFKEFVRELKN